MIYLTLTGSRSFDIIPRFLDISVFNTQMIVVNQSTNVTISVGENYTYDDNGILTIGFSGTLEEGNFYTIKFIGIGGAEEVKWKGIIFASDQVKVDYTINKDEFKENTSNNEYIILD